MTFATTAYCPNVLLSILLSQYACSCKKCTWEDSQDRFHQTALSIVKNIMLSQ